MLLCIASAKETVACYSVLTTPDQTCSSQGMTNVLDTYACAEAVNFVNSENSYSWEGFGGNPLAAGPYGKNDVGISSQSTYPKG